MFSHSSLNQPNSFQNNTDQSFPERIQKVVKITQVVKGDESEPIDLNTKKEVREGSK